MALDLQIHKKLAHFDLDLNLHCEDGKLLALVGPSGSGKTTAIRIMAGLEKVDQGAMYLGNKTIFDSGQGQWLPAQKRQLGYVFQEASLFPHLRVRDNVAFACPDSDQVELLLGQLGINHLAAKKPHQISGGEQQRVAFAQALASGPQLLLLDEPFSALDVRTRESLQNLVLEFKEKFQIPMILVTHDLHEAGRLADEIIALDHGRQDNDWLAANSLAHFSIAQKGGPSQKKAA